MSWLQYSYCSIVFTCHCPEIFDRSQMISVEDCEFIKKFEVANSEEKQVILTNEGHQVWSCLHYQPICFCFVCVLLQHMIGN